MSRLRSILAIAAMISAVEEQHYGGGSVRQREPEPEWKRKKCKTCISCGNHCFPYTYKGHTLIKLSKPTFNACSNYKKK